MARPQGQGDEMLPNTEHRNAAIEAERRAYVQRWEDYVDPHRTLSEEKRATVVSILIEKETIEYCKQLSRYIDNNFPGLTDEAKLAKTNELLLSAPWPQGGGHTYAALMQMETK